MKTSTIKASKFSRKWDGDNGTVFYHDIELDNGDKGSIGTKEQDPDWLNVGQSLNYELIPSKDDKYPPKIKRVTENKGGFQKGGYPRGPEPFKVSSMSIAYAKDLVVAGKIEVKETTAYAQKFYDWIKERE